MATPLYLFKENRPTSCFIDQIYDPDIDGSPYEGMPKLIPMEGGTAIDRNTNYAYVVTYVNPVTYKTTLSPFKILVTSESEQIKILSYGNDKFTLYFDDRVKPTKLNIDSKLILFGSSLVEYRLVKTNADKEREIISVYIESNTKIQGDRIPLTNITSSSAAKICTNCHTFSSILEGDMIELEVFDTTGVIAVVVQLFVKRSTLLNDLASHTDIITSFDAVSNQMLGSDFYIYPKQDPIHLGITPIIRFADGAYENLTIDNISCFLYGLENFTPAYAGQKRKILIKKYLANTQQSPISVNTPTSRYITVEKNITVVSSNSVDGFKISIIPYWRTNDARYDIKYVAYFESRDKLVDVSEFVTLMNKFDGNLYNTKQTLTIDIDVNAFLGLEESTIFRQVYYITLQPTSNLQKYIFTEDIDDLTVYGVDSPTIKRPVIEYDNTLKKYFIPTSKFKNKAALLEAFYYKASPLYNPSLEVKPIVPTHFTIRAIKDLSTIISAPINIDQYNQAFNINLEGPSDILLDDTVIVEFLSYINNQYQIIYGVPVDVRKSVTGYNLE